MWEKTDALNIDCMRKDIDRLSSCHTIFNTWLNDIEESEITVTIRETAADAIGYFAVSLTQFQALWTCT